MVRSVLLLVTLVGVAAAQPDLGDEHKIPAPRRPQGAPQDAWIAYALEQETSPDSYCQRNLDFARKQDASTKNTCGPLAGAPKAKLAGKWTDAKLLKLDEYETGYVTLSEYIELAVQYDGKWFVHRIGHISHPSSNDAKQTYKVRSITVKDVVPGGAPELLVEVSELDHQGIGGSVESRATRERLHVCGIGASGAPSCVDAVVAEDEKNSVYKRKYGLAQSFDKKGRIVLRAKAPWPRDLAKRDYEGTRPLFFL
jgi:hypothetical protein